MDSDKLLLNNNLFNRIFNNIPSKIFAIDREYRLTYYNDEFEKNSSFFSNCKLEIGMNILPIDDSQEEWKNCFDIVMTGGELILEKNYVIDSFEYYDLIRIIPIKENSGFISGCIYYAEDILPLKKVEKILLEEKRKYHILFENNLAGIVVTNKDLYFIKCNQAMLHLAKVTADEILNINIIDFFLKKESLKACEQLNQLKKGEIYDFKLFDKFQNNKGEEIYVNLVVQGIYKNGKFDGSIITVLDVTPKYEAQKKRDEVEELKQREEQNKYKQIELENELNIRNRELYANLMLVVKQNNFLDTLEKEITKISKKVGDSTKLDLVRLNYIIKHQKEFEEYWEKTKIHFENIHPNFFQKINQLYPKLTEKELRHCAYLKMGLSNKETSQLLHVMPKSIEMARYRLKKKLKIKPENSLSDFFRNF